MIRLFLTLFIASLCLAQEPCTFVTLTGTMAGPTMPQQGRASAHAIVHVGNYDEDGECVPEVNLLFDSGRGVIERLGNIGMIPADLDAIFLSHLHSDHLMSLQDIIHVHWMMSTDANYVPLKVFGGERTRDFVENVLCALTDEVAVRTGAANRQLQPTADFTAFLIPEVITPIWEDPARGITVSIIQAIHGVNLGAVSFLIQTAAGTVVYSGDTTNSTFLDTISTNADLWIGEVFLTAITPFMPAPILAQHISAERIGDMAVRVGIQHVVFTHMIPTPGEPTFGNFVFNATYTEDDYIDETRSSGYGGPLDIGQDLMVCSLPCDRSRGCCEEYDDAANALTAHIGLAIVAIFLKFFFE